MLFVARGTTSASTLLRHTRAITSVSTFSRSFAKRRDNNVEGRDRYEILGESASYEQEKGITCRYPPFRTSCSLDAFRKSWDHLEKGERAPETEVCIAGNWMFFQLSYRKNCQ